MNILDIVFPKRCVGCKREGPYICLDCQRKLVKPEAICPMCCKPSLDGWVHPRCRSLYGMERLIVGLPYRGMVQDCLKKVKYKSAWDIVSFLYLIWRQCIGSSKNQNQDLGFSSAIVTSVPMWRDKERSRGFNQAEIIGKLLAASYKVPSLVMLERTRETKPQFGLNKEQRTSNIEGAFKLTNQQTNELTGKSVVLVDDVWTTGSTMRECAKVLKQAGASQVWGLAIAR